MRVTSRSQLTGRRQGHLDRSEVIQVTQRHTTIHTHIHTYGTFRHQLTCCMSLGGSRRTRREPRCHGENLLPHTEGPPTPGTEPTALWL